MSLQSLSAAFPNLLLFFIFIVAVVSLLSCKLMQRGLMLELAPYADSKPLSANKVYHVRLSLILRIFIYLAWRGKQREIDGIIVISYFFFLFHIYLDTMKNFWKVYFLFDVNVYVFFVWFLCLNFTSVVQVLSVSRH